MRIRPPRHRILPMGTTTRAMDASRTCPGLRNAGGRSRRTAVTGEHRRTRRPCCTRDSDSLAPMRARAADSQNAGVGVTPLKLRRRCSKHEERSLSILVEVSGDRVTDERNAQPDGGHWKLTMSMGDDDLDRRRVASSPYWHDGVTVCMGQLRSSAHYETHLWWMDKPQ
ncbi:hypothetical protein OH76DRAFT_727922 [Lentinus brumalis]|uniref:Uncharacterized protein n=1 Tax=Lentinus brumalis TaxID=2498619 RepID=A0A371D559_9APHY|nr:hypothetical protein OH76DRAFT_727922 [Polyporus brumalis]